MSSTLDTMWLVWNAGGRDNGIALGQHACGLGTVRLFTLKSAANAAVRELALPPYYHYHDLIYTDDDQRDKKNWVKRHGEWKLRNEAAFTERDLEEMLDSEDEDHLTVHTERVVVDRTQPVVRESDDGGSVSMWSEVTASHVALAPAAAAAAAAAPSLTALPNVPSNTSANTTAAAALPTIKKRKSVRFDKAATVEKLWVAATVRCCRDDDRHDTEFKVAQHKAVADAWLNEQVRERIADEVDDMDSDGYDKEYFASSANWTAGDLNVDCDVQEELETIIAHKQARVVHTCPFRYCVTQVTVQTDVDSTQDDSSNKKKRSKRATHSA